MEHHTLSLYHIVRKSSLNENAPLLIMLHGYGSDENDLFSFASELPEELFIISLRAPYPMQPFGNAWYAINFDAEKGKWSDNEQAIDARDLIAKFIDEAISTYPVNKYNVTLLGFSQGTILSYAVALTYPEKVKNIIALSGYINQDIVPKDFKKYNYSHLDFYCSHGSADQVIPVDWARQTPPLLNQLNIKYYYSEFPVGHGVSPQNFYEFRKWLAERLEY
ncbi:alpha/beta hydrolase [Aestuariivivens sp. NBU2969]|uniref:alpha/beta hydrolase n=1 Tax=Aestuariivivens sp. NBU2969 TaxID=2873267 RepID=UPI001CBB9CE5|nr:alpha/beta fold hydrolase [Aestuariivivens sp. NBU2969]